MEEDTGFNNDYDEVIDDIAEEDAETIEETQDHIHDIENTDIQKDKGKKKAAPEDEIILEDESSDEEEEISDDEEILKKPRKDTYPDNFVNNKQTDIIVKPENRKTSEYITIYELAKAIGIRATHISRGSPIFVDIEGLDDPRDIAKKEIREGKCPLMVKRRLGSTNRVEKWSVNEMIKPDNF